ncbi:hypothetical protein [Streptomyces sp. NPDC060027]|uniref:hypothetical protein n=1 Tax=Streptomyces sp. NPDC060027 TaxID=3347040 RepID=UPI0036849A27
MIAGKCPAEDATVLRYGLRRLLFGLPLGTANLGVGGMGCWIAADSGGIGLAWILAGPLMAVGLGGVFLLVSRWRARHWITAFDATGFWWMRGKEVALIRWDSLTGAGIYWARSPKDFIRTVELCPRDEIDRDDPLLWRFVRDTDPLRPDLPRLRYRVDVGESTRRT